VATFLGHSVHTGANKATVETVNIILDSLKMEEVARTKFPVSFPKCLVKHPHLNTDCGDI